MIDTGMLDELLESLLLVSGGGLKIEDIASHLEIKTAEVNASVKRLKEKYGGKCGIHLITYNGKVQFASNPAYSDVIACVLNPIRERDLSNAALETIAIIAYRQPVTRLDIEQIRGVNSEYTVQMLLKNNLIEVVGRKEAVGKPLLFGTTDEFLKRFQLESIADLPDYETLLESIKVIGAQEGAKSIYNEFEIPDEQPELPQEEIPDFLKDEEGLEKVG
ncbi:MAG: SMC-Scp complex subunit ScpB [Christensenellales bacterium]|jgi:segregation and condensation protein B